MSIDLDYELVQEFLEEAREQCARAEAILLGLEDGLISRQHLDELFRFAHTVKGSGMAVGLSHLPQFVHVWEDVLSATRAQNDPVVLPAETITLFLECNDAVSNFVSKFPSDTSAEVARFEGLGRRLRGESPERADKPCEAEASSPAPEPAPATSSAVPPVNARTEAGQTSNDKSAERSAKRNAAKAPTLSAEDTVRVKLSRIDALIRKIGEVSVQQELVAGAATESGESPELDSLTRKLAQLCTEAHDIGMSLRMVPIRPTVQTLRRTVRDTALKLKKKVEFVADGESAELDVNLVQVLSEGLVHLVRNAVDHGIEEPAQRMAAGKPEQACVFLAVAQQGGNIQVIVRDDGKGLDVQRIRRKAIERGWISPDANPTHAELFEFVFRPGFSTNESVTEFSGRGVGLDVVSSNIKAVDGSVRLTSEPGVGTTFEILMPLSVAVVDVMKVLLHGQPFLIPLHNIRETVAITPNAIQTVAAGAQMINLRACAVPIYDLRSLLICEPRPIDTGDARTKTALISAKNGQSFGFIVDDIVGRQQVVIKPLGPELSFIEGISGSAVLGDGSVGLIVDLNALISSRGLTRE
jgi:two-component system chemotaxis sensor kinase CheA